MRARAGAREDAAAAVLTAIGMLGLVSKRFTGIGAITHVDIRPAALAPSHFDRRGCAPLLIDR